MNTPLSLNQAEFVQIAEQDPGILSMLIQRHRIRLSNYIVQQCGGRVIRGPFTGMILPSASGGWGDADRGAMALGLYEQEILDLIINTAPKDCVFVNLGAADGYYGIGMVKSGRATHAHCFEIDPRAQEKLRALAGINGVQDKLTVYGKAESDFYRQLELSESSNLFILCDVEGYEYELFSNHTIFNVLRNSHIVIEIHDWDTDLKKKTQNLLSHALDSHRPTFFSTGARDLSVIDFLRTLDDTNRWLICSEGRPKLMEWCHLSPL